MVKYIILGIIQGLTEFFPVSSSAHLVIVQNRLGMTGEELAVSIVLHLGTALALIIFFFRDIIKILKDARLLWFIAVVSAITFIIYLAGKDFFERLFSSVTFTAIALMVTGVILILTKRITAAKRNKISFKDALVLGVSQGIAIIPGISRSGITISTLLFRGIDAETSFRFSFLAAIPAVLGAALLKVKDISSVCSTNFNNLAAGFILSLLTGLFALWVLKLVLHKAKLYYFGYYCIIAGVVTLLFLR